MICFISACNNDSVSDKQAESFLKYYAVGIDNTGTEVIQTSDGYAIMGNFENGSGQKDIFIIFTDEFGRQKTGDPIIIGTDDDDHGYSMIRLGDGYLISGTSFNETQKWGYLVNISSDGRVLWEQNYSGYQELEFRDAYEANDGNLIMTGYSIRNPGDDMEAIIAKTSTTGELKWLRTNNFSGRNDVGEAIIEHQKRYHVLTTSTNVSDINLSRIRMLNTDTKGRAPTNYEIKIDYLSGKDITKITPEGNMYILGNNEDPASRVSSIFLGELELISEGQITTLKNSASIPYTESLHAESFAPVEQKNELAIGGWQVKPNDNDILFLSVDIGFQDFMLKTYGSKGYQASQNIIYTGDGGFALTGSVDLADGRISMLLKIDSDGELR
ncbi:hypothetical protein ES705_27569 [subsurface metagenome]